MYRILECGGKNGKRKIQRYVKSAQQKKARNLRIKGKVKSL
jgi:hypothetical protein